MVFAIHLMVFGSLFSGLPGPAALGELKGEGTIIGAVAVMLSAMMSGIIVDVRGLRSLLIFLPFAVCILLSYAFNAGEIASAHFLGREGGEKFFKSVLVIAYFVSVFFAVSCIANVYGVRATLLCGSGAAVWCGGLLLAEFAIEIVSWFVPPLREIWRMTRWTWVSYDSPEPLYRLAVVSGRLVGFASEPSFNAIALMGLLGLMGAGVVSRGAAAGDWLRGRRRPVTFLMLALFALELLLGNARTFYVAICGAVLAWLLLGRFGRWLPASLRSAVIVLAPLAAQAAMIWAVLKADPSTLSSSTISRSVGMLTASQLGAQNPLFGLGFGQYGFHFRGLVPSWGLESYEVARFFRDDQYNLISGLQPSFSMFSRMGAELGVVGLSAWLVPPIFAIRRAILLRPGAVTTVIACAMSAQIWSWLSFDSFRNVYYWLYLAILLAWPSQRQDGSDGALERSAEREIRQNVLPA